MTIMEVLNNPLYEPYWYVGFWFFMACMLGQLTGECVRSFVGRLIKRWLRKRNREEAAE